VRHHIGARTRAAVNRYPGNRRGRTVNIIYPAVRLCLLLYGQAQTALLHETHTLNNDIIHSVQYDIIIYRCDSRWCIKENRKNSRHGNSVVSFVFSVRAQASPGKLHTVYKTLVVNMMWWIFHLIFVRNLLSRLTTI